MKTKRQMRREAKELFGLCLVEGALNNDRVRLVVRRVIEEGRGGSLGVLTCFQRLVRLDRARQIATVESASPLLEDLRVSIRTALTRRYGQGITTSFVEDPALLGGVRITVGSDVYDGTIRGRLAALEARF